MSTLRMLRMLAATFGLCAPIAQCALDAPRHDGCVPAARTRPSVGEKKVRLPSEVRKPRVARTQGGVEPQEELSASRKRTSGVKNSIEDKRSAKPILFVGLDVHKESISIGLGEPDRIGEVRHYGAIPNDLYAIQKLTQKKTLRKQAALFGFQLTPLQSKA